MLALGLYPLVVVISFVLRPLAWTLQSQWLRMQAADARPATHHPPRVTTPRHVSQRPAACHRSRGSRRWRPTRTRNTSSRGRRAEARSSSSSEPPSAGSVHLRFTRREWPEIAPENDTRSHGPHRRAAVPHTRRRRGAARPRAAARAADRHARGRRGSRRARLEHPGRRAAVLGCHVCRGVLGRAPTAAAARRGRRCGNNNN